MGVWFVFLLVGLLAQVPAIPAAANILTNTNNCLAARLDFFFRNMAKSSIVEDVYVYANTTGKLSSLNSTLCTADPDPIYLADARCQCDAAKRLYMQSNPAATSDTAFSLYSDAANAGNTSTPSWHCEACPNTAKQTVYNYVHLNQSCTCIAARAAYLTLYPTIAAANVDPVYHYEAGGAAAGRIWNCSVCGNQSVFIDDPFYQNCQPALQDYAANAWWTSYFNYTFLAYWNSYYYIGKPVYHYDLCPYNSSSTGLSTTGSPTASPATTARSSTGATTGTPTTATPTTGSTTATTGSTALTTTGQSSTTGPAGLPAIITSNNNCLQARLDFFFRNMARSSITEDVYLYAASTSKLSSLNSTMCTSDPDPIYMNDTRCQCDAAKKLFMQYYPGATLDTAWSLYVAGVASSNPSTPSWFCEACPNTARQFVYSYKYLTQQCTCMTARQAYFTTYPAIEAANVDPVFHYEAGGKVAGRLWDCTRCGVPIYIDDPFYQNCQPALANYTAAVWWASNFNNTFLAYWNSFYIGNGKPIYHYELCPWPSSTTGSSSTTSVPTGPVSPEYPTHLALNCTCMAARLMYWAQNIPVYQSGSDPVAHYDRGGWNSGRTWNCDLCSYVTPVYITDSISQCQAAQQQYFTDYPKDAAGYATAFDNYISVYISMPLHIWHAELCPGVVKKLPDTLQLKLLPSCTCLAARLDYWNRYPTTRAKDPVYHYNAFGIDLRYTWDCTLCGTNAIMIDDPTCSSCVAAKTQYLANDTVGARFYLDPFLHYWNGYMAHGEPWHCELCVNVTTNSTGNSTGGEPAGDWTVIPEDCDCLQANNYYLARYPDVLAAGKDPAKHFIDGGQFAGREWNCHVCEDYPNPIWNSEYCNCPAAQAAFVWQNAHLIRNLTNDNAWQQYLTSAESITWPCTLCNLPIYNMTDDITCNAARADYLLRYPQIQSGPKDFFDPVYFHTYIGHAGNYTWNGGLCAPDSPSLEDSVCDCPEAATQFQTDYPNYNQPLSYAYDTYITNYQTYGMVWRCEVCSNTHLNPLDSLTCNCTTARALYRSSYPQVVSDPWVHYSTTGRAAGYTWDCSICNDTCMGLNANHWVSPNMHFSTSASVVVPAGCSVPVPSQTTSLNSLSVKGSLRCDNSMSRQVSFSLQQIDVTGTLTCGSEVTPFDGSFMVTLFGAIPPAAQLQQPGGTKGLTVHSGAVLSLHGAKKASWTHLQVPGNVGDLQITVVGPVDWKAGDQIVVSSTDGYDSGNAFANNEIRTISSISGNVIRLNQALAYFHDAESVDLSFSGSTITFQKRAEVALITRSIQVWGDPSSSTTEYGTRITALPNSNIWVSGIGLYLAGQQVGSSYHAYPFQWSSSNATGQYFKQSTIYKSYQGCVGLDNTTNALVQDNACIDFLNGGFALVSGDETGNTFDSNLGIALNPTNSTSTAEVPAISTSPVFLISNPNNVFTNNFAAASSGVGYWINAAGGDGSWGGFTNNTAHSVYVGYSSCPLDGSNGVAGPGTWLIDGLSVYGAELGILPCGPTQKFTRAVIAESTVGFESNSAHAISSSAFVSSLNTSSAPTATYAVRLLGSGWAMDKVLFKNYVDAQHAIFEPGTSTSYNVATSVSKLTLQNSPYIYADPANLTYYRGYLGQFGATVYDSDGTLTGHAMNTLVTNHPLMWDSTCAAMGDKFSYSCPYVYTDTYVKYGGPALPVAAIGRQSASSITKRSAIPDPKLSLTSEREETGGASTPSAAFFPTPSMNFYRWTAMVNSDYVYTFLLPITTVAMTNISMPTGNKGDSLMLLFSNVLYASNFGGGTHQSSCAQVFSSPSATTTFYFDFTNSQLCVRLVATTAVDGGGYTAALTLSASSANITTGQPPQPYNNGPNTIPDSCKCINASVDYWQRYPDVLAAGMDPVYHFQEIGGYSTYSWNCQPCAEHPHFFSEPFCNCTDARGNYTAAHPEIAGVFDPYQHFLLYELYLGWGYHCEICPVISSELEVSFPEKRLVDVPLSSVLGAIVGVGILLAVFGFVMLIMRYADYSKHGTFYSGIILIGGVFGYVSALIPLPQQTDALCLAFPWFLGVGFTLVYGCLFIKTWAIYQVWRKAEKFQKTNLTPFTILRAIGLYLLVEVIILVVWSIVDRPKAKFSKMVDDTLELQCKTEHVTFWIIFVAVKGLWLMFGASLTVLTRRIASEYNQSASIGYAIYNIAALLLLAIPLSIALQNIPNGLVIVEVAVIVIAFTFTLVSLFFDIWYHAFFPKEAPIVMKLASLRTTPGGTGSATTRSSSSLSKHSKSDSTGSGEEEEKKKHAHVVHVHPEEEKKGSKKMYAL